MIHATVNKSRYLLNGPRTCIFSLYKTCTCMHIRRYQNWGRNDLGETACGETAWGEMVLGAKRLGYGGEKRPGVKIEAKRLGGKRLGGETTSYRAGQGRVRYDTVR